MLDGLTPQQQAKLDAQLDKWQQDLVNLTKRNKLLHFRHTKTSSLEIVAPTMPEVHDRVGAGWRFHLPPDAADDVPGDSVGADGADRVRSAAGRRTTELLTSKGRERDLLSSLRTLERTSTQMMLDTGLWVLYLGYGMLRWIDPADGSSCESPLLLQPVALSRPGQPNEFVLESTDDDPIINPALAIKLTNDFGLSIPTIDDVDGTPGGVAAAVRSSVAGQRGWTVEDRVVLTTFTFHKEAMFRDLIANRDRISGHSLVRLAAVGASAGAESFSFDPLADADADMAAPPEDLVSIRDADSTQRACIVAARDGRSFVMDGPPGTGKSQTIANIIAELLHAGRSVLFVSEKAAALEVVANRLAEAGLDPFVLELHSHKATRREVATELGRALESSPRAQPSFSEGERARLRQIREELTAYAAAVNERRAPLGRSLHDVIGDIVRLQDHPHGPVARAVDERFTPERHVRIRDAADRLARAWGPIARGDSFLWRSLRELTFSAARQQQIEGTIDEARRGLELVARLLDDIDASTGFGWRSSLDDGDRMRRLLAAIESHPRRQDLPLEWLTEHGHREREALVAARKVSVDELNDCLRRAVTLGGPSWEAIPHGRGAGARAAFDALVEGAGMHLDAAAATHLTALATRLPDIDRLASSIAADAATIASSFGLPGDAVDLARCDQLVELTSYVGSATPPERTWLDPFAQAALIEATTVLKELIDDFRRRRESLRTTFTDGVLDLDLAGLRARFAANTGLKKLGGTYRSDKRLLASCVVGGRVDDAALARLDEAIAWAELRSRLLSAESMHSGILGEYYRGPIETDLDRVDRALTIARRAIELCGGNNAPGLARQLGAGGQPDVEAVEAGRRLAHSVAEWRATLTPVLTAVGLDDTTRPVHVVAERAVRAAPHLRSLTQLTEEIGRVASTDLQLAGVVELAGLVDEIARRRTELESTHEADRSRLGPTWQGEHTDFESLRRDMAWASLVTDLAGEPLERHAAAELAARAQAAEELGTRMRDAIKAWTAVADLFDPPWRDRLSADFGSSFETGLDLLAELRDSVGDIDEWARYATARQQLIDEDLAPVVAFAESNRLDRAVVAEVVERSVLEGWADAVIAGDDRLRTLSPSDRDDLVESFRRLDRSLVANAAASVINACAARRPSTTVGVAGIIRREAQKKTRHKPIRNLLSETREAALALKPCFMMSPLSVSQFLPPDIEFDAVIFDEASQVKPADAVNCIYRGRQLIVAGDPRQLPPTSFFEHMADEGVDEYIEDAPEDFESVLDIFLGSGLPPLSLRWHYRSQHESLITYSNYRFYEGRLHTFPGAIEEAADVGVALIAADGVYRRGGARDNPIEAARVVDRVLLHRREHPDLTLGVVAFSTAQEAAIVAELERRRATEPEVAALMTGEDRLDGFFVKNLENVQGDERDIILFSVGYGRDENGRFTEQLGPLGKQGGERRLNVAITRARRRVEVVSSIRAADFPGTSQAPGVRHLQRYLDFADRGVSALALELAHGGLDAESVFEEMVIEYIQSLGHTATPQVGVAGYRIDIGVRHPGRPGEFVLGIECDGAAYHSSRVARDRDRLRQQVLEGLGWRIHRIWGPSWFRDRRSQETALRTAIDDALAGRSPEPRRAPTAAVGPTVEFEAVDLDAPPTWTQTYRASGWLPSGDDVGEVHLVPVTRLGAGVAQIVRDEGPVHEDVVRRRLADAYGVRRIGERLKSAFDDAIAYTIRRGEIERCDRHFLKVPAAEVAVRVPDPDDEATRRPVGQIAPTERQRAIEQMVLDSHRIEQNELKVAFGRLFGWRRVGADIDAAFGRDLDSLRSSGRVRVEDGSVAAP